MSGIHFGPMDVSRTIGTIPVILVLTSATALLL